MCPVFFNILSIIIVVFCCRKPVFTLTSTEYIIQQIKLRNEQELNSYVEEYQSQAARHSEGFEISWKSVWKRSFETKPHPIVLRDRVLLFDEKEVHLSKLNSGSTVQTRSADLKNQIDRVQFFKSYNENEIFLLLSCYDSYCKIHDNPYNSRDKKSQIINYYHLSPIDAEFFGQNNKIHLVISYGNGPIAKKESLYHHCSVIYQLSNSIFTFKFELPAFGDVEAFKTAEDFSTILLIAQENFPTGEIKNTACVAYKITENRQPETIQILADIPVKSVFSYVYDGETYVLVNQFGKNSEIFWWNGFELMKWMEIPDMQGANSVKIVYFENTTLLFASDERTIYAYKIWNGLCLPVEMDVKQLNVGEIIAGFDVWSSGNIPIIVLIKKLADNTYVVEYWQLNFRKYSFTDEKQAAKVVNRCFRELEKSLENRQLDLQKLVKSWANILPKNPQNVDPKLAYHLPILNIEEANVTALELVGDEDQSSLFSMFLNLKSPLMELEKSVAEALNSPTWNHKQKLYLDDVQIEENAFIESLHITNLVISNLNDKKFEPKDVLMSGSKQNFSAPLKATSVVIENLEIPSHCGIPFNYWIRNKDNARTKLENFNLKKYTVENGVIIVEEDFFLEKLNVKVLNNVSVDSFFSDLFLIGSSQLIAGNVNFTGRVETNNVHAEKVNNISANALITVHQNQQLNESFFDSLEVGDLFVERINGIPINRFARASKENVIKGKVTLTTLIIKDQLIVDENLALPFGFYSTQYYTEVLINGDLFVQNLDLSPESLLKLDGQNSSPVDLLENSWSTSRDLIINHPVIFEKEVAVDRLNCQRLNGIDKSRFLFTDSEEFSNLNNVIFSNVRVNGIVNEETGQVKKIYLEDSSSLIFEESVHIQSLTLDRLFARFFNGIPIDAVMDETANSLIIPGETKFHTLRVSGRMTIENLTVKFFEDQDASIFQKALRIDQDLHIDNANLTNLRANTVFIEKLNGKDFGTILRSQLELNSTLEKFNLTVEGDLEIENLNTKYMAGKKVEDFVKDLKSQNLTSLMKMNSMSSLRITKALRVEFLNGIRVNDLFSKALSKYRNQELPRNVKFGNLKIKSLTTDVLNGRKVSDLMFVDGPLKVEGDLRFKELVVEGNVTLKTLNGQSVKQLYDHLQSISISEIKNLKVIGNLSWEDPSDSKNSLNYFLSNAFRKDKEQLVKSPVEFEGVANFDTVYLENEENSPSFRRLKNLVRDAAVDDGNPIHIDSTKVFSQDLTVKNLEVNGNIDMDVINERSVYQLHDLVLKGVKPVGQIASSFVFRGKPEIGNLSSRMSDFHGVSLQNLLTFDDEMPKNMLFKNLEIFGSLTLERLDGVLFDEFLEDRITLTDDIVVLGNVEFESSVRVLGDALIGSLNGINPSELVVSGNTNIPTVISGKKIFASDLEIFGNLEVAKVNDIDVLASYKLGALKDENTEIFGDLIFQDDVDVSKNLTVHGFINGSPARNLLANSPEHGRSMVDSIQTSESLIGTLVAKARKSLKKSQDVFFYLELEENLKLYDFGGVQKLRSVEDAASTLLYFYNDRPGEHCSLAKNCPCRMQTVVEVNSPENVTVLRENSNYTTFGFRDANAKFGLKVKSTAVSSSQKCSRNLSDYEGTKMLWIKYEDGSIWTPEINFEGFVSDVQTFSTDDKVYVILAIYYDRSKNTHKTESLVFEFDLTRQSYAINGILTDGAKALNIFGDDKIGRYLLIGCTKGKKEALLLKFNRKKLKFELLQKFTGEGGKFAAGLLTEDNVFTILYNWESESLKIYRHSNDTDCFMPYQNLHFGTKINGLEVFYLGETGKSDTFITVTTKDGRIFVYNYNFYGKFQIKVDYWLADVKLVAPFQFRGQNYLLASSKSNSTVFRIVKQSIY